MVFIIILNFLFSMNLFADINNKLVVEFFYIFYRRYLIIKKKQFWKRIHRKLRFWTSTLRSNSGFIDLKQVLYVSYESLRICPQHCVLSSTTLHGRSVPLSDVHCSHKQSGFYQAEFRFTLLNFLLSGVHCTMYIVQLHV